MGIIDFERYMCPLLLDNANVESSIYSVFFHVSFYIIESTIP